MRSYHSAFNTSQNDYTAVRLLRQQFKNLSFEIITEFAERTKHYLLQNQFKILIEKYTEQFFDVVNFANKHCAIRFESDAPIRDVIDPILQIYNN